MSTTLCWRKIDTSPDKSLCYDLKKALQKKFPSFSSHDARLRGTAQLKDFLEGIIAGSEVGDPGADPAICTDAMKLLKAMREGEIELYLSI